MSCRRSEFGQASHGPWAAIDHAGWNNSRNKAREHGRHEKSHWNPGDYVALSSFLLSLLLLTALQQTLWLTATLQLSYCPIQNREMVKKLQKEWWNKHPSIWSTTALTWQLLLSRLFFILLATNIKEASWKLKAAERLCTAGKEPMANRIPRKLDSNANAKTQLVQELCGHLSPSNPIAMVLQHPYQYQYRTGTRGPPCPFSEQNQLPEHICLSKKLKSVSFAITAPFTPHSEH